MKALAFVAAASSLGMSTSAQAASATWTDTSTTGTQQWSTGTNWNPATAAGAVGTTNDTSTAIFSTPNNGAQTINIDSGRNVENFTFTGLTGTVGTYSFVGSQLVLTSGGAITTNVGTPTATISPTNITLEGNYTFTDNGTAVIQIQTPTSGGTVSQDVLTAAPSVGPITITLNGTQGVPALTTISGAVILISARRSMMERERAPSFPSPRAAQAAGL